MKYMPKKRGFQLTEGDIEILMWVYRLRLATVEHLEVLTGRSKRPLNTRLMKLTENGYLYRRRSDLHEKYIYTIDKEAGPVLVERGIASPEIINLRVRLHELTNLFLKHALMLTDIHVTLELASRNNHIKLREWREGNELHDKVGFVEYDDGKRIEWKLPVRPDAFFMLEDTNQPSGRNRSYFFVEADRSTTTNKRFQRKVRAYWHYYRQGLHTKKYKIKGFRVLTITLTEARALNLCKASCEVLPSGQGMFYYFTSMQPLSNPAHVFDDIFISPKDFDKGVFHRLIPSLAK